MSQNSDIDKAVESVDAILRSSSSSFWQFQCSKQSTNSSLKSTDPTAYDTCAYYKLEIVSYYFHDFGLIIVLYVLYKKFVVNC